MKSNSNDLLVENSRVLLFEIVERISRFHLHLSEIQERFYTLNGKSSVERNEHLLNPYYECLKSILRCSLLLSIDIVGKDVSQRKGSDSVLDKLQNQMSLISQLHQQLGFLPRPPEPVELKRFGRILTKHSVNLGKEEEISIYVDEKVSEELYVNDPLYQFKTEKINPAIEEVNTAISSMYDNVSVKTIEVEFINEGFHVTIPRIDAGNSCRWPTLVHEFAHKVIEDKYFQSGNILKEYSDFNNITAGNTKLEAKICLEKWLEESWCDLFGAIVMGPSFLFSQASAFMFSLQLDKSGKISPTHPPPLFRLLLIENILKHRFKDALSDESTGMMRQYIKFFEFFDLKTSDGFTQNPEIKNIWISFKAFFIGHFFKKEDGKLLLNSPQLNDTIETLLKYSSAISESVISDMAEHLKAGVPIPSHRAKNDENNRRIKERPALVQEVLFAAWIYRNNSFKDLVLNNCSNLINHSLDSECSLWNTFLSSTVNDFKQFNDSVLRSIQVGEWFNLLKGDSENNSQDEDISTYPKRDQASTGVLSDYEIYDELRSGNIKVIPLINVNEQLGSTSLDIRLGTSFQIYYPNQVGIIDLTDADSLLSANNYSNFIDLDFRESIPLAPGQFVLAHSMEYISLPGNLCAELDGRSSFARLGIEIHITAGFIDPGFQGVLTYEIFNAGPNPIKLFPGLRIGQLRFFPINTPKKPYNQDPTAKYRGLLQHRNSLQSGDYEVSLFGK